MIRLFTRWLQALIDFGLRLAGHLVAGILGAPATALGQPVIRRGGPRDVAGKLPPLPADSTIYLAERGGEQVGSAAITPEPLGGGPSHRLRALRAIDMDVGRRLVQHALRAHAGLWCYGEDVDPALRHSWRRRDEQRFSCP